MADSAPTLSNVAVVRSGRAPSWLRGRSELVAAGVLLLIIVAVALVGPVVASRDPNAVDVLATLNPVGTPGHLLGTDQVGRDILSRIIVGMQTSLVFGIWPAAIVLLISTTLGLVSAYVGGLVDSILMRVLDVLLAFPFFILAIALVTYLGPSLRNAMLALIVVYLPGNVRVIRSLVLSLRERTYVEAATILGYGPLRIMFGELLPGVIPNAITLATLNTAYMIAAGSALSFLGLGVQPPTADLGSMIAEGKLYILTQPSLILVPVVVLSVLTYSLFAFGDALQREVTDLQGL